MSFLNNTKYILDKPFTLYTSGLKDYISPDKKLHIAQGVLTLNNPFEWNGMTHWREGKLSDDVDGRGTRLPKSWVASMIHDALYTYMDIDPDFPMTRKECDIFLRKRLSISEAYPQLEIGIIYIGARLLGGIMHDKSEAIILNDGGDSLGKVNIVYNKDKQFNELASHVWILTENKDKKQWIRLTYKGYNTALSMAMKNPEDMP